MEWLLAAAGLALLAGFVFWQNNGLTVTRLDIQDPALPDALDGLRIAHLSDLHNKRFGKGQRRLLQRLAACAPDLIVLTGDTIGYQTHALRPTLELLSGAARIAPVYLACGNHESACGRYERTRRLYLENGAVVLDNETAVCRDGKYAYAVAGLQDPSFFSIHGLAEKSAYVRRTLPGLIDESLYTVVLSHRPELLGAYADAGARLVLSGHAHGGQWRIPFTNIAAIAPGQGLFPKYTAGLHEKGGTKLIISRGLGNSLVPLRLFNRPEIVLITLKSKNGRR